MMTENPIGISFTVKFIIYYFAFSHILSNKIKCQNQFVKPWIDTPKVPVRFENDAHQAQYPNEIQMQYRPQIQNNFQYQNEYRMQNADEIQIQQRDKAQRDSHILNKNQKHLEPNLMYERKIPYKGQQLFGDQLQYREQISDQGQQIPYSQNPQIQYNQDLQIQYNQDQQIYYAQAQKPYIRDQQLQYKDEAQPGTQTSFVKEWPNNEQALNINEIPNYAQPPFGNQMPNSNLLQYSEPNDTILESEDEELLNNAETYERKEGNQQIGNLLSMLLANNMQFAIRNGFKYFQEQFFRDIERDTRLSIQSRLIPKISPVCLGSLKEFQKELAEGKMWAIRMIDSFGKIPSGILDGTFKSFGDFDMCVDTKVYDFQGRYCLVEVSVAGNNSMHIPLKLMNLTFLYDRDFSKSLFDTDSTQAFQARITTSVCLPTKCSKPDIQGLFSKVSSFGLSALNLTVVHCLTRTEITFNSTQKTIFCMIIIVILFEAFATFLDVRLRNLYGDQFDKVELKKAVQCILAFSYYSNSLRLFKKDENPDSIKIFHGMKFFTLAWVILGHTISFFSQALGRFYDAVILWGGFAFQIVVSGFVSTETFFFLSGFLVVYSFIKSNSPRISFFIFALYRYIRLMPPVLLILGILLLSENFSSGPLWKEYVIDYLVGNCKTFWWRNILFINNMTTLSEICLPWTWYIAVDMQLYLLSYFILLVIKRNPKKALWVLKIFIGGNVIGIMIYHYVYNLPPNPGLIYIHLLDRPYFTYMMHVQTLNHVTPYCIGMIAGYVIATKTNTNLSGLKKLFGSCMAILFGMITLFLPYIWNHRARIATVTESVLYGGTHRLFWSLALFWMVYLCLNGEASIIKGILSWNVFVPLARLTYSAFLIHPFVQMLFLGHLKHIVFAQLNVLIISYFGFLVVSYAFAFVFCLICESPFSRLLSILISSKIGKSGKEKKKDFSKILFKKKKEIERVRLKVRRHC